MLSGISGDPKTIVAEGFDRCARDYVAARVHDPSPELELLSRNLRQPARILDVGCGAGLPVTLALSRMGTVVGVDLSAAQIALAQENVPSARFVCGDIVAQHFEDASFDAVVAFYSLFHIPQPEQRQLLSRFACWLRPGGFLLATLTLTNQAGYTQPDFFGVTMYWSHYEAQWYVERLEQTGFEILRLGVLGGPQRGIPGVRPWRLPVVFARLRKAATVRP